MKEAWKKSRDYTIKILKECKTEEDFEANMDLILNRWFIARVASAVEEMLFKRGDGKDV